MLLLENRFSFASITVAILPSFSFSCDRYLDDLLDFLCIFFFCFRFRWCCCYCDQHLEFVVKLLRQVQAVQLSSFVFFIQFNLSRSIHYRHLQTLAFM